MNGAIMVALGLSWFGVKQADAVFAVGIGGFILYSAFKMVKDAIQTLLDRQLPENEIEHIRQVSLSVKGVLGIHDVRTRMSGPVRFIQLHLELDDDMPLIEAHRISDVVEEKLCTAFPGADILIHQDPLSVILEPEKKQKVHSW